MEGPVMQANLLAQLEKQLAEARARIADLQRMANVGEMFMSLVGKTVERRHATVETVTVETMLDWIDRAKKADARIAALQSELSAMQEKADVRGKLADAFGEVLCQIAGTNDRVRACAIASDKFAAMQARAEMLRKLYDAAWAECKIGRQAWDEDVLIWDITDNKHMALNLPRRWELAEQAHDTARRDAGEGEGT